MSVRLDDPLRLKLLSILIGVALLTKSFSMLVTPRWTMGNNLPLYNVYFLVETMVYATYFYLLLKTPFVKKGILLFCILFPLAWVYMTFWIFGFPHWNSYGVIMKSCFVLAMCITHFYELFTAKDMISLLDSPEFWVAAGLLIYFTSPLPLAGMLNYLNRLQFKLAANVIGEYQNLNILLYTVFTYAFLCRIITRNSV